MLRKYSHLTTTIDTMNADLARLTVQYSNLNIFNSNDTYNDGSIQDLDS